MSEALLTDAQEPVVRIQDLCAGRDSLRWRQVLVATPAFRVVLLSFPPGFQTTPHWHPRAEEVFHILEGAADFRFGQGEWSRAESGSVLLAARTVPHEFRVLESSPLLLAVIVAPNEPHDTIELTPERPVVP